MEKNEFEIIDIKELIPQRPPFIMIDRLIHFDRKDTVTNFTVREDNIFLENGQLDASALVENIAQTCAARMGYVNLYVNKDSVKLGFIGSIKNMQINRTALLGETLTTTISVVEEIMRLTLVTASIKIGEEEIVTGEMKIALSDIDSVN